jgi:hypothetical protein
MSVRVVLGADDLAALVRRGLGPRIRGATCAVQGKALRIHLQGLEIHRHVPRCDVALDLSVNCVDGIVDIGYRIAPSTWSAVLLVPGQRLGGGRMVVEALVDRLGLRPAVMLLSDVKVHLNPARIVGLTQLGLVVSHAYLELGDKPALVVEAGIWEAANE